MNHTDAALDCILTACLISDIRGIKFNPTYGAFYNTIIFEEGVLNHHQYLEIENPAIRNLVESWVNEDLIQFDQRFVYYLLGAKGVCVVPSSSFCSNLLGFRVTLLEDDENILIDTFTRIKDGLLEYLNR